jgi:hypothetical protein
MAVHHVLCGLLNNHNQGEEAGHRSGVAGSRCNKSLGMKLLGLGPSFCHRHFAVVLCRRDVVVGYWTAIVMHGSGRQERPAARIDQDRAPSGCCWIRRVPCSALCHA